MKPASITDVFNRFLLYGYEKGIFEAFQIHSIRSSATGWVFSPAIKFGMIEGDGISPDEYIRLLEGSRYSAVFDDGSILYLECIFHEDALIDHRYFFIPCPFDQRTISSKPRHLAMADWLRDSLELEPRDCVRSKGVFRFDCVRNPPKSTDPHPISHLTVASRDCRIPVRGPLQISTFLNFTFDNFFREYRPVWWSFSSYLKLDESESTITQAEMSAHHLDWEPSS